MAAASAQPHWTCNTVSFTSRDVLLSYAEKPDESGSFMSTAHKTVISARAAVTGLEANSLSSFISGEEQIGEKYNEALAEPASLSPSITTTLTRQKAALLEKIELMKRMQA